MKNYKLEDMVGGWFVGDFSPAILQTKDFEVAVKLYSEGQSEDLHHHKLADEITVIASGRVQMNGRIYSGGDIVHLSPGDATDFQVLEDTVTVVVKTPSVIGDKYDGTQ